MNEALALVRRELGPDAAVLHTREVRSGRLFGLLAGQRMIEVTASRDVNVPSRIALKEPIAAVATERPSWPAYTSSRSAAPPAASRSSQQQPVLSTQVQEQLTDLQTMLKELCQRSISGKTNDLPEELLPLYAKLIDADLSAELAKELVERVRDEARGELLDLSMLQARIARMIEADLSVAGPIAVTPGRCRVAALVGPTGVGKTTTIAKLAANYRLKEKLRVGLITVDTDRLAAVEQLRTSADVIDLPLQVVSTPREIREAVRQMSNLDLLLIDTAGRSPKDAVRLQELKVFLNEASADQVYLVLSGATASRMLEQTVRRFAAVGITALILSKVDEADGLGNILPVLRSSRLPVSYLTNGRNVPDDIEVADPRRLAKMILGLDPT